MYVTYFSKSYVLWINVVFISPISSVPPNTLSNIHKDDYDNKTRIVKKKKGENKRNKE